MMEKLKPKGPSVRQIFDFLTSLTFFSPEKEREESPVTLQIGALPKGEKVPILAVIVGENANGKSFLRRVMKDSYRRLETELIDISMEGRRRVAYNIGLTFVYGDEDHFSTGDNATKTVTVAFSTSRNREKDHAIFWDEPDVGLSEGWAACMGREIAEFLREKPEKLQAVYLVTHSRPLLRELRDLNPLFVYVGNDREFASLDEWLEAPLPKYKSLEDLQKTGLKRFRKIAAMLNEIKKDRA
jgi:hypothetical protein